MRSRVFAEIVGNHLMLPPPPTFVMSSTIASFYFYATHYSFFIVNSSSSRYVGVLCIIPKYYTYKRVYMPLNKQKLTA